jgi:hypothetical protein
MAAGMTVDPSIHTQVLEVKLAQLTTREALLEAAVQQLTLEISQHGMEIERLQNLLSPPAEADAPAIEVTE